MEDKPVVYIMSHVIVLCPVTCDTTPSTNPSDSFIWYF